MIKLLAFLIIGAAPAHQISVPECNNAPSKVTDICFDTGNYMCLTLRRIMRKYMYDACIIYVNYNIIYIFKLYIIMNIPFSSYLCM